MMSGDDDRYPDMAHADAAHNDTWAGPDHGDTGHADSFHGDSLSDDHRRAYVESGQRERELRRKDMFPDLYPPLWVRAIRVVAEWLAALGRVPSWLPILLLLLLLWLIALWRLV